MTFTPGQRSDPGNNRFHPADAWDDTVQIVDVSGSTFPSFTLLAAPAAGVRAMLRGIAIANNTANNTYISLKCAGVTRIVLPCPANSGVVVDLHLKGDA